ncbi:DNA gyrase inhibitor YacG [Novosphingobium sp. Gsoil 351]|uniref:DNA gyrase inhibitor YacG n=1 Tax=Novosphingobium sp. Gsoil 351 TaxID=2675225 RepID=UPI0012B47C42|nr:DNA gyrase inhibitor YacG [Novosphingobium sp. Gsoil 351]QGN53246.1 DNA gyrase inhibitor YacG [Novosphingobium sp. Gsoil 351]
MNRPVRKCPVCGKPRSEEHSPFCSTRCRDRDLVRWLDDGYVLPGPAIDPDNGQLDGEEGF